MGEDTTTARNTLNQETINQENPHISKTSAEDQKSQEEAMQKKYTRRVLQTNKAEERPITTPIDTSLHSAIGQEKNIEKIEVGNVEKNVEKTALHFFHSLVTNQILTHCPRNIDCEVNVAKRNRAQQQNITVTPKQKLKSNKRKEPVDYVYYKPKPKARRKRRRRKRGKGRKISHTASSTNCAQQETLKIGYVNAQGRVMQHKESGWSEVTEIVKKENWDIMMMVETHWRDPIAKDLMQGYNSFTNQRPQGARKGGGIATFVNQNTVAFEWRSSRIRNETYDAEYMWTVLPGPKVNIAIGLIYLSSGRNWDEWNTNIQDLLMQDMAELRMLGHHIILIGDFNGHIEPTQNGPKGTDHNGKFIEEIIKTENMCLLNWTSQCQGKWTWMRGESRSEIDFCITDQTILPYLKSMYIDEKGEKWSISSDHCFTEITQHRNTEDT